MSTADVVFFGSPPFAVACLEALCRSGRAVRLVVTQPDRPAGRGRRPTPTAVKEFCRALSLPFLQPAKVKDPAFHRELRRAGASCFVLAAYGRLLPQAVLEIPELALNVHASILPRWRGAAPAERAILAGDSVTGVSIMRPVAELDAGDVCLTVETPIGPDEAGGELLARLAGIGAQALLDAMDRIDAGTARFLPQDPGAVTLAPAIGAEEGKLDWTETARKIHDRVRAMNPRPGAFTGSRKGRVKIHRTRVSEKPGGTGKPGALETSGARLFVFCGDGRLEILELQREGRQRQSAEEFLRGYRPDPYESWG